MRISRDAGTDKGPGGPSLKRTLSKQQKSFFLGPPSGKSKVGLAHQGPPRSGVPANIVVVDFQPRDVIKRALRT